MSTHKDFLVAIADAEHARLVRNNEYNVLHTERWIESVVAHKKDSDLRSDHPGATFHSNSTARHSVAPKHEPHEIEAERFAEHIAHELNRLADEGTFDKLVVVAPADTLHVIERELNVTAQGKLAGTLYKDLVKTPDAELYEHLRDLLPPPHPPRKLPNG
jgi:protein required for attachment to host cells